MSYSVEVDFSPAYELALSLNAFMHSKAHKSLELGMSWVRSVQDKVNSEFVTKAQEHFLLTPFPYNLLIWKWRPAEERTAEAFLHWLSDLSVGELYELIAPHLDTIPNDLTQQRDLIVEILTEWNEVYFRHFDPQILTNLAADAEAKRQLIETMSAPDLVELATNGFRYQETEGLEFILIIPQYHNRPFNVSSFYLNGNTILYPADAYAAPADQPPSTLLRLTQSLADENRLRMLRYMVDQPRTFTDLVQFTGLAKSTVYHHIVSLRSSGLVRAHATNHIIDYYSLRENALDELRNLLGSYLKEF